MDINSGQGHQSLPEEIPSSDSLGLRHPLLPPPALGQSFLQPHTLSPLGAVSLINLDTSLTGEKDRENTLYNRFSAQGPTEIIDDSFSGHTHISPSVGIQFPEAAQPKALMPKASVERLQPPPESVSAHQEQPPTANNADISPSNAAPATELEQSPSSKVSSALNDDQSLVTSPAQPPSEHPISPQSSSPHSDQAESVRQTDPDQSGPNDALQPKQIQAPELGFPATEPQSQESTNFSVPSPTENASGYQASAVVSEQPNQESKQKSDQTKQQSIAHPPPEGSKEVSPFAHPPEVSPLQAKPLDNTDSVLPTIQESPSNHREQATHRNSDVKPPNQESLPLVKPTHSDSPSIKDSETSGHLQPSYPEASSFNDTSVAQSKPKELVGQNKEVSAPEVPRSEHNPNRLEQQVSGAQFLSASSQAPLPAPNQEQQVSEIQLAKSPSVSSQKSQDVPAANKEDGVSIPSEGSTDKTTDLPINQTVKSSPSPSNHQQTSNSQSPHANPRVETNPSIPVSNGLPIENTATPSTPVQINEKSTEPTTVQRVAQPFTQQSPDDQPLQEESYKTPNDLTQTSGRPIETTSVQRKESSTAQTTTDTPLTPTVETKQTSSSHEPSITENPSTLSSSIKADREAIQEKILQRSDSHSPQASTETSATKQKKQSKKSKQKKIPLQTQLLRAGERAKQDINKVGKQLKQASDSLPIGKSETKARQRGSTSNSPQLQPSNTPSLPAASSPDSKQSSPELSLIQSETQASEQTASPEKTLPKAAEVVNHQQNASTVQAIPESDDSSQEHPSSTPIQTQISEPTIQRDKHPDSNSDITEVSEPIPNSKGTRQNQIESESSASQSSAEQKKASDIVSSPGASSSRAKSKKRRQFPTQPLQRLTSFSKQVVDTVSRQIEPHPDEGAIPQQTPSSASAQISAEHTSGTVPSQRTIAEGKHPQQPTPGNNKNSNDITAGSALPGTQAQPSAPDADLSSQSSPSASVQGSQEGLANLPIQKTTEENLQTQSFPISQTAESPPLGSVPLQPEKISAPSRSREPSTQEKQIPASLSKSESQSNVVKPEWQALQNQVADELVNLGSKIKERVNRSIRRQISQDPLSKPKSAKEASSVEPTQSLGVAETNLSIQPADVSESNEDNIQASAEPNSGKEQTLETDPVQLAPLSNSAIESLEQTGGNSVVTPSLDEDNNLAEVNAVPPIQTNSIDEAEVKTPQQDSEQSDATLRSQNKNSIQKSQNSSELTSVSPDHQSIVISESSQSRDRNNPLNSPISKIGTTIVQQLANLRPKKAKSKRKTKKQKSTSPAQLSSEKTSTPSIPPASNSVPDQISQSTDQPEISKPPTVQTQASPNTGDIAVQSQHISEKDDAGPVQNEMVSDQPPRIEPSATVDSPKSENLASDLPSPLVDSSAELNSHTSEFIQPQPISAEGTDSNPPDIESSSYANEPNIQRKAELPSPSTSNERRLASQKDYVSQGEVSAQAAANPSTGSEGDPIQHQATSHPQTSQPVDDSIKQSTGSTVSNTHPQTVLPVQAQKIPQEDLGISDTQTPLANPSADQDSLSPQHITQDQSTPSLPDSDIQHSLEQTVPATASTSPECPPIGEISIQTKVEYPSTTHPIQPQQQLTPNPHSSAQHSRAEQNQLSSESKFNDANEISEIEVSGLGVDPSTSLVQTFRPNFDNVSDSLTQTSGHNLDSTHNKTFPDGGQDFDIQEDHPSPTIQAKVDLTEKNVSETISSPAIADDTNIASPQSPNSASDTADNIAPLNTSDSASINTAGTNDIIQLSTETSEPENTQLKASETPELEDPSAPSESTTEESNLASKPTSNVPIQTVEISVVQPKAESQPQQAISGQSFDESDRIQASTSKAEDNLSIQPTSDSQLSQSTEPSEPQQIAPQISSQTPPTVTPSVDLSELAPVIQSSTVEESHTPNAAPTDISEESGIIQSTHQPNTKSDSTLSTSSSNNSDQVNSNAPTHPNISDTETPELQQLTTENIADSSPQVSESIQPQPDKIDSSHRRVIEISAQLPEENSGTTNPPAPELSSSPSSDLNQNQPLQPKLENNASLTEAGPGLTHTESSPDTAQKSEVAEVPQVSADSNIQASTADHIGPPLTSTKSQSLELNQPIVQRQAEATPDGAHQEIEEEHTSSDSTDSPQRRVIELAAKPPESDLSEGNSPDLTVAQLLANGQAPSPLSSISDNLVSPKHLSSLLPTSKPKRQSQAPSHFPSLDAPPDLVSVSGDVASFEDTLEVGVEGAIAPAIQRSNSRSDQALPSSWSSIEDLFTAQPQSPKIVQRKTKSPSPASVTTSDLVLTPTGIYPEKQVQRKPAPIQRTQTVQKVSATPPVSSTPPTTEVVMRQFQTEQPTESEVDEQNFEILAREIYHVLRQRLEVERERHGGYHSGRLPW
ncbi:hypothetical protein [Acaryochloris sp. IP29b_bin.137]|uniref:hypothetical protein n=1 Tax=Acaryochloris sp. IP29b_bin.137 TaxID=2969217 RepID=UPI00262A299D|nr:hypothetical protein [Acaryochloris sp. IP29b_bin.137]